MSSRRNALLFACFLAASEALAQTPGPAATTPAVPKPTAPAAPEEDCPQWVDPPGPATREETALVERANAALTSGSADVSAVLIDPVYMPIHARTEFRNLIAAYAEARPLTIAAPREPGTRLSVTLEFVTEDGAPAADAVLYAYQTSAKGCYSDKAAHIRANAGDVRHARLFGYARTDSRGRVELRTIRPSGYPRTDLPAHIHLHLTVKGREHVVGEVRFDDDPRMTPEQRKASIAGCDQVVRVTKRDDGSQACSATFRIR